MKTNGKISMLDRLSDSKAVARAMGEAIQETLREHKLLGFPIVVWKDGKSVWIPPEEIELADESAPVKEE